MAQRPRLLLVRPSLLIRPASLKDFLTALARSFQQLLDREVESQPG